ncbi:MAG: ubiquinone/menaquinone biosynthesis methyltransferase [Actinobacteria bacterium]|nr:ubiquinone/menaquinone biosynthesis methyltransferase [Actinomycetota bacterium]
MQIENDISKEFLSPMFDSVRHYDLINHIFTFGMDKRWRKKLVEKCLESKPAEFMDLGCGTGDLAINIALAADENIRITACDFSREMLAIAAKKSAKAKVLQKISFIYADACSLPFADNHFDTIGISFAFRNMIYKNTSAKKHLSEIYRVLKPGGSCMIAESSQPAIKIIRILSHFYIRTFVYLAGSMISGNRQAYRYLSQSAINFYNTGELKKIFISSGFKSAKHWPLFLGAAAIYELIK